MKVRIKDLKEIKAGQSMTFPVTPKEARSAQSLAYNTAPVYIPGMKFRTSIEKCSNTEWRLTVTAKEYEN